MTIVDDLLIALADHPLIADVRRLAALYAAAEHDAGALAAEIADLRRQLAAAEIADLRGRVRQVRNIALTVHVQIDGHQAGDVADDLAIDAEAGHLDHGALNWLRAWLGAPDIDAKIAHVLVEVGEGTP